MKTVLNRNSVQEYTTPLGVPGAKDSFVCNKMEAVSISDHLTPWELGNSRILSLQSFLVCVFYFFRLNKDRRNGERLYCKSGKDDGISL